VRAVCRNNVDTEWVARGERYTGVLDATPGHLSGCSFRRNGFYKRPRPKRVPDAADAIKCRGPADETRYHVCNKQVSRTRWTGTVFIVSPVRVNTLGPGRFGINDFRVRDVSGREIEKCLRRPPGYANVRQRRGRPPGRW